MRTLIVMLTLLAVMLAIALTGCTGTKPCVKCGGPANLSTLEHPARTTKFRYQCGSCNEMGTKAYGTEKSARRDWNGR